MHYQATLEQPCSVRPVRGTCSRVHMPPTPRILRPNNPVCSVGTTFPTQEVTVDDSPAMLALIGTIDRVLSDQGVDADVVTEEDKLLLAIQYVETGGIREKVQAAIPPEVHRLGRLFCPVQRASQRSV